MLYLVEATFDGEPIGIWNDRMESYYIPGQESAQGTASGIVNSKGTSLPWSVWVEQLSDKIGHRRWWLAVDSAKSMVETLSDQRQKYFSDQDAQVLTDK